MENNREIINLYKELSDCLVEQVGQDKYRIISRDGKSLRGATLKQIKFYVSKHKYSLKNKKIIFNKKQTFHKTLQNPKDGLKVFHKKYGKKYPILYVDGLTKYYGKNKTPTISNVNFIIKPGEFHAFIGANGAGKTTTIKSIITAYSNWNGTIMINGLKNTDINSKKYIAYFPERAEFPESISTYNYLFWMAKLNGIKGSKAKQIVNSILKKIGIWNLKKRNPNSFSSGQKKKVLLAQTLLNNPKLIIMDEPTAMLDPETRSWLLTTMNSLVKNGASVFISSHVLSEVEKYATHITVIDKGKILYTGTKKTITNFLSNERYSLQTSNNLRSLKIIKKNKFKYYFNGKNLVLYKNHVMSFETLLNKLINENIKILNYQKLNVSLEDLYKELVTTNIESKQYESKY